MTQPGPFERLPLDLLHLRTCVHGPGEHEEKVGQSVNVDPYRSLDNIASQCNNPALYSAAYGARQVQCCSSRRAARQNELPHLRQFFVETINPRLQPFHGSTIQIDLRNPLGYPASRVGQSRTNRKKVALHMRGDLNQVWLSQVGEHQPKYCVQLVNLPAGLNPRIGLRQTGTIKKTGLSVITATGVDRHSAIIVPALAHRPATENDDQ